MSEQEKKKTKPAAAPAAPALPGKKPEAVIYVGPTLPRGQLQRYATFLEGKLPQHVEDLKKSNADLAGLFVPVGQLAKVQMRLNDPASAESERVRRVIASFNKGE